MNTGYTLSSDSVMTHMTGHWTPISLADQRYNEKERKGRFGEIDKKITCE